MTFREKLAIEHPSEVYEACEGGCFGCPVDYDYEPGPLIPWCTTERGGCTACWDREIPEDKEEETTATGPNRENDPVNHPAHYTAGGIECIDAIASALTCQKDPVAAWLTGQVIKYLWRWPLKNGAEDLKKARFYLDRLIERESK